MSATEQTKLIGVIDAGSNSVKFVIYQIPNFNQVCVVCISEWSPKNLKKTFLKEKIYLMNLIK